MITLYFFDDRPALVSYSKPASPDEGARELAASAGINGCLLLLRNLRLQLIKQLSHGPIWRFVERPYNDLKFLLSNLE